MFKVNVVSKCLQLYAIKAWD